MSRSMEFALKVNANMDGNLQAQLMAASKTLNAFKNAANLKIAFGDAGKMGALSSKLASLQGTMAQIEKYRTSQAKLQAAQEKHAKAVQKNSQAAAEKQAAAQKVATLKIQLQQMQEARASLKRTSAEYKSLGTQIKATKAEIKSAEQALKAASQAFTGSQNKMFNSGQGLSRQISELQRLRSGLTAAGVNVNQLAAAERALNSSANSTTAALQRQVETAHKLQNLRTNFNNAQSNFNDAQSNFQAAENFARQVMSPFVAAAQNAMDYEYQLKAIEARTQLDNRRAGNIEQAQREMAGLDAVIRQLGATTEYTTLNYGQAGNFFAVAGWDMGRIKMMLPILGDFATATQTAGYNFARLADMFSDDLTAAGLKVGRMMTLKSGVQVEEGAYFANAMSYALNKSNMDAERLHESNKYYMPIASNLGLRISDMLTLSMITANSGIKGSQSGTAVKTGLMRLVAPSKAAQGALAELGMTMSDAQKEYAEAQAVLAAVGKIDTKNFSSTLQTMSEYLQTLDSSEQTRFINDVFGKYGAPAWMTIFKNPEQVAQIAKWAEDMESGDIMTYLGGVAGIQRESAHVQFELLKSSIDSVVNNVGTALLPFVISMSQALAPLITKLSEWIAANPEIVQGVAAVAASLSALAVTATGVAVAFAGWNFVTAQLALVRAMLAGFSLTSLTASVTAAGSAFLASARAALVFAANTAIAMIGGDFSALASGVRSIGTAFMAAARGALAFILTPVGAVCALLAVTAFAVYQNWDRVGPVLSNIASIVGGSLSSAFSTAKDAIGRAIDAIGRLFDKLKDSGALDAFAKGFLAVVNVIAGVFSALVDLISGTITIIANGIGGLADAIGYALEGEWLKAGIALKDMVNSNTITAFDTMKNSFRDITGIYRNTRNSFREYDRLAAPVQISQAARVQPNQNVQSMQNINTPQNSSIPQSNSTPPPQSIPNLNINPNINVQPAEIPNIPQSVPNFYVQSAEFSNLPQPIPQNYIPQSYSTPQNVLQPSNLAQILNSVKVETPKVEAEVKPITFGYSPGSYFNVADLAKIEPPKLDTSAVQSQLNNFSNSLQTNSNALQTAANMQNDYSFSTLQTAPTIPENYSFQFDTSNVQTQLNNFSSSVESNSNAIQAANQNLQTSNSLSMQMQNSFSNVSMQLEGVNVGAANLTTGLENANVEAMNLTAAVQQDTAAIQAHTAEINNNIGIVSQLGAAMSSAISSIQSMANAAANSTGSITNLSSVSSSAAAAISGLGSAVSAAISSVHAAAASSAPTSAPAQNYNGGIYNHGAFLTWFAEKSPEAAIPLDGSQRAISLWQQAGQILGIYPENNYNGGIYGNFAPSNINYNPIDIGAIMTQTRSKISEILQSIQSDNIISDILSKIGITSSINISDIFQNNSISGILSKIGDIYSGGIFQDVLGGLTGGGEFPVMTPPFNPEGNNQTFNPVFNMTFNVPSEGAGQQIFEDFRTQFEEYITEMHRRSFE